MRRILATLVAILMFGQIAQAEIVSHPSGCPRYLFCGCGAAVEVYGEPRREMTVNGRKLNLYWAPDWYHFPRAEPAPGMVGVTRRHVFVLREHRGGKNWLVYDANSGGRKTRIHVRSIAGYTIVNPHGGSKIANADK